MLQRLEANERIFGRGVYDATEAVRLLNFKRDVTSLGRSVSRNTISRWLTGYDYMVQGEKRHSEPLWQSDYVNDNQTLEISFRDLIELRFVKAFRDAGLGLPTIRECFLRAVEEVKDERPFSTSKFRTDGKTIFLDITHDVREGELIDLRRKQASSARWWPQVSATWNSTLTYLHGGTRSGSGSPSVWASNKH